MTRLRQEDMPGQARLDQETMPGPVQLAANATQSEPARVVYIKNPMAPGVGAAATQDAEGLTVLQIAEREEWKLAPRTVLILNGEMVKRAEWEKRPLTANDDARLVVVPAGGGSGNASNAIVGAVLVVVGAIVSYYVPPLGAAIMGVGLKLLASGLFPVSHPPAFSTPPPASPTYSLSSQTNGARLNAPVPEVFGRHKVVCDLLSQPYTDYAGNEERVYQLFGIGVGEYDVQEIGVATNPVWSGGNYTGSYPEIEIEIVPPGNLVTLFPDNVATSSEVSSIQLLGTDEAGYNWSGGFIASPPGTTASQLAIDVGLPGGLFSVDGGGALISATVTLTAQARTVDDSGSPTGNYTTILSETIHLSTRDVVRTTYEVAVTPARYQVRVERTNAKGGGSTEDTLYWLALRAFLPGVRVYGDLTAIAVKAKATANLNGQSSSQFYAIVERKLPTYDAGNATWSGNVSTRAIADAAAYICRGANAGNLADSGVDYARLYDLHATWEDRGDHFDGVFDQRSSWLEALQSVLKAGRAFPLITGPQVTFVRDEAKSVYRAAFTPRMMVPGSFANDYTLYDSNEPDAAVIQFIDNRTWKTNYIFCALPGAVTTEAEAMLSPLPLFGVTDRDHVWREGMFMVADAKYRRQVTSFQTENEGRVCFRGDLVGIGHWQPGWAASAEALSLTEDSGGDIVTLSEPWSAPAGHEGETKLIALTTPDGRLYGPVQFSVVNDGNTTRQAQVRLLGNATVPGKYAGAHPRDWPVWSDDGLQLERPRAIVGTTDTMFKDAIVRAMKPGQDGLVTVECVIENPLVHEADTGDVPEEEDPPGDPLFDDLVITSLGFVETALTDDYQLNVAVSGAPDAVSFEARWKPLLSVDYGSIVGDLGRAFSLIVGVTDVAVQVRAIGRAGIGDWDTEYYTASPSGPVSLKVIIDNLSLDGNLTLCLDAGNVTSYGGSGQTWSDISGAGNHFYRGDTSSSEGSDPTFHGTAGNLSSEEYFSSDGGDYFTLAAGSNPAWANVLQNFGAIYSGVAMVYFPGSPADGYTLDSIPLLLTSNSTRGVEVFLSFEASYADPDDPFAVDVHIAALNIVQHGDSGGINADLFMTFRSASTPAPAGWYLIGFSLDTVAGTCNFTVNGATFTSSAGYGDDDGGTSSKLGIGNSHSGSQILNGARVAMLAVWDKALTLTNLSNLDNTIRAFRSTFGLP